MPDTIFERYWRPMNDYSHLKQMISETVAIPKTSRNNYGKFKSRTRLLLDEAEKKGWTLFPVWKNTWLFLDEGRVIGGTYEHALSNQAHLARTLATHKEATKLALSAIGVPVPEGKAYEPGDLQDAVDDFAARTKAKIMKPSSGATSTAVTLSLPDEESFIEAWSLVREALPKAKILVEDLVEGFDVRVIVVDGKAVAAASRVNPFVIGDGQSSINELIAAREDDRQRSAYLRRFKTPIDDPFLEIQGVGRDTIIADGVIVLLNRSMNVAGGGESINVFGAISQDLLKLAERAASVLPFQPIVGVDILIPHLSASEGTVLELNVQPHFDLHHYITYGESINVAALEIDSLAKKHRTTPQGALPSSDSDHTSSFTISFGGPIEIRMRGSKQ